MGYFSGYDVDQLFHMAKLAAEDAAKSVEELYVSKDAFSFTDVVEGEKCYNGGEYGFYTHYTPIPFDGFDGVYVVETTCTCDFNSCGTGFEGIKPLTVAEYNRLREKSDAIEAAGSQY